MLSIIISVSDICFSMLVKVSMFNLTSIYVFGQQGK